MTTTKKKQTRKSVSMPGYVYDAFSVACEAVGVPMAAQNERLVRDWLATQRGEVLVAPDKPARVKKEKPARAPKPAKPPKEPKPAKKKAPRKKGKAVSAADPVVAAAEAIGVHAEIQTEAGVLHVYPDGTAIEHLDEPTAEMEDSAEEALAALSEPEPSEPEPTEEPEEEEYVDDREIVVDEFVDEF